ncbi:MAG: 3-oxoacyl-ACP reductase FabG [Myxococcales bacterium]|nr:3-oxoacyl-ACP reductase FabG [Myxococcales bacterium]
MRTTSAGRSVIVTGASRGIGRGIARVFAQDGARVLLVARDEQAAIAAARELADEGCEASAFAADVGVWDDVVRMAAAAVARHGGVDVLCANAGIYPARPLADMTVEAWDEVLRTNLTGALLSVKACMEPLKRSGQGRVILTSSITGPITGYPGWSHYAASKAGQLGFMRAAALELAPFQITVNALLPGNIMTEGLAELGQAYLDRMRDAIPLARLGAVEDIGHAARFLASPEAGFITGQALVVDGGQTLPESLDAIVRT